MPNTQVKFELDQFQKEAIESIRDSKSVIVCAPTGSGKTIIAEEAINMALADAKKVFYTAPLKALINQKYHDFAARYGSDKVGIITGDKSNNRDAQIIVMTTEIYRNMLYGTTFGSVDTYLEDLQYVIFDEFHYIGDSSRGTVWEESVIYSPKSVQLIALSATINNPEEIQNWIKDVHGDCALVQTENRPVPLHHFYFKDEQLLPLLTPNGKLNPKLKERNDSRFGKNKFNNKSGRGNKAAKPEQVVDELAKKNMLPAIFFVFSRKGCDGYANQCEKLELLSAEEKSELENIINAEAKNNSYIANYQKLELLKKGIASHHSGLLPAIKTLIETLFSKGLIKVVFSTETLAAGINMPARTTVISSIGKMSDSGYRVLKVSEYLQMAGRAGRRGIDDIGYVVTLRSGSHGAADAAMLAASKTEDIDSSFKSSYEMVLNLLTNQELADVKDLIYKSFGHSLILNDLKNLVEEKSQLEDKIMDLQTPLCPGEIGDLQHYKSLQENLSNTRKQKKKLEKEMSSEVTGLEEMIQMLTAEAQNYPCNGCPKQKPCSKQMQTIKRFRNKVKDINSKVSQKEDTYWQEFEQIVNLLKEKNYLDENNKPSELGKICATIRSENSFFLTELLTSDFLKELSMIDFLSIIATAVIEPRANREGLSRSVEAQLYEPLEKTRSVARNVVKAQRKYKIFKPVEVTTDLLDVLVTWVKVQDWEELMKSTSLDDGDVLKGIRRTLEICKQISKIPQLDSKIKQMAEEAITVLEKEPVMDLLPG